MAGDGLIDAHYEPMAEAARKIDQIVERVEDVVQTMNKSLAATSDDWDMGARETFNNLQRVMNEKLIEMNYWSSEAANHVRTSAQTLQDTDQRLAGMLGNVTIGGRGVA